MGQRTALTFYLTIQNNTMKPKQIVRLIISKERSLDDVWSDLADGATGIAESRSNGTMPSHQTMITIYKELSVKASSVITRLNNSGITTDTDSYKKWMFENRMGDTKMYMPDVYARFNKGDRDVSIPMDVFDYFLRLRYEDDETYNIASRIIVNLKKGFEGYLLTTGYTSDELIEIVPNDLSEVKFNINSPLTWKGFDSRFAFHYINYIEKEKSVVYESQRCKHR